MCGDKNFKDFYPQFFLIPNFDYRLLEAVVILTQGVSYVQGVDDDWYQEEQEGIEYQVPYGFPSLYVQDR